MGLSPWGEGAKRLREDFMILSWNARLKLARPKPQTPSKGRPAAMGLSPWGEGAKRLRGDFMIVNWSAAG